MTTQTIDSKAGEPHTKPRMLKPERVHVATDHEDSSDLDFCVQKAMGAIAIGLYVRHSEQEIFDLLVGMKEYECHTFRGVKFETLRKETIKAVMDLSPAPAIYEDQNLFCTREALEGKGVFYYLFLPYERKNVHGIFEKLKISL